jgi:dTDP-4-amino-4,6-dideoxygalactose transaminase
LMKRSIYDLAILGGEPAFREKLHVGRPNVGNRERFLQLISEALDRRWLSNDGPLVKQLESRIAEMLGVKHVIAVSNGTVGLQLAIRALRLRGEVIVPSFTFVATAHAVAWQGAVPVFVDIRSDGYDLDPEQVEKAVTPKSTGIIAVHVYGRPCDVESLNQVAKKHGLRLLFDAAHAFGCSYKGMMIGSFGDAEVLSFHATKFFNTFEGGAVVTNDDDLAEAVRVARNFGFAGYDEVVALGINGKMSEAAAAMGLANLESLDDFVKTNWSNYRLYRECLDGLPGLRLVEYNEQERCNYQYVVVEIDPEVAGISRDVLHRVLWAENVLARRYFYPGCHKLEPYRSWPETTRYPLPNTERAAERVLALPTGTAVKSEHIRTICDIIRLAVMNAKDLVRKLTAVERL